jgi:hypothetical protein
VNQENAGQILFDNVLQFIEQYDGNARPTTTSNIVTLRPSPRVTVCSSPTLTVQRQKGCEQSAQHTEDNVPPPTFWQRLVAVSSSWWPSMEGLGTQGNSSFPLPVAFSSPASSTSLAVSTASLASNKKDRENKEYYRVFQDDLLLCLVTFLHGRKGGIEKMVDGFVSLWMSTDATVAVTAAGDTTSDPLKGGRVHTGVTISPPTSFPVPPSRAQIKKKIKEVASSEGQRGAYKWVVNSSVLDSLGLKVSHDKEGQIAECETMSEMESSEPIIRATRRASYTHGAVEEIPLVSPSRQFFLQENVASANASPLKGGSVHTCMSICPPPSFPVPPSGASLLKKIKEVAMLNSSRTLDTDTADTVTVEKAKSMALSLHDGEEGVLEDYNVKQTGKLSWAESKEGAATDVSSSSSSSSLSPNSSISLLVSNKRKHHLLEGNYDSEQQWSNQDVVMEESLSLPPQEKVHTFINNGWIPMDLNSSDDDNDLDAIAHGRKMLRSNVRMMKPPLKVLKVSHDKDGQIACKSNKKKFKDYVHHSCHPFPPVRVHEKQQQPLLVAVDSVACDSFSDDTQIALFVGTKKWDKLTIASTSGTFVRMVLNSLKITKKTIPGQGFCCLLCILYCWRLLQGSAEANLCLRNRQVRLEMIDLVNRILHEDKNNRKLLSFLSILTTTEVETAPLRIWPTMDEFVEWCKLLNIRVNAYERDGTLDNFGVVAMPHIPRDYVEFVGNTYSMLTNEWAVHRLDVIKEILVNTDVVNVCFMNNHFEPFHYDYPTLRQVIAKFSENLASKVMTLPEPLQDQVRSDAPVDTAVVPFNTNSVGGAELECMRTADCVPWQRWEHQRADYDPENNARLQHGGVDEKEGEKEEDDEEKDQKEEDDEEEKEEKGDGGGDDDNDSSEDDFFQKYQVGDRIRNHRGLYGIVSGYKNGRYNVTYHDNQWDNNMKASDLRPPPVRSVKKKSKSSRSWTHQEFSSD